METAGFGTAIEFMPENHKSKHHEKDFTIRINYGTAYGLWWGEKDPGSPEYG